MIIHGETGLLVPAGNSAELAMAIQSIISDQELATRLAKAGKIRVMQMFSSEAMVRGVTQVYDDLISRKL